MQKNYISFGQYKVYTNIKQKTYKELQQKIKEKTYIRNLGNGEMQLSINPQDVTEVINYELDVLTNIRRFIDGDITKVLDLKEDTDLQEVIDYLYKIIIGLLKECQDSIIKQLAMLSNL